MLKLKLQYFGCLMRKTDCFEKTLMLGKIEGWRRRRAAAVHKVSIGCDWVTELCWKSFTPKYIIIKVARVKEQERILKASRENQLVTYKVSPIRLSTDFFQQKLWRPEKSGLIYSKCQKQKNFQPTILCLVRLSFGIKGHIKNFQDKQKLRDFTITKLDLQEMLKELL